MKRHFVLKILSAVALTSAQAQTPVQVVPGACQLPDLVRVWSAPALSTPSVSLGSVNVAPLKIEQRYRTVLERCDATDCQAGLFRAALPFRVTAPGRYRVSTDQMLWIDVHDGKGKIDGLVCEHTNCAPVRKMLQYNLAAGVHWVVLEGKSSLTAEVVVAHTPH